MNKKSFLLAGLAVLVLIAFAATPVAQAQTKSSDYTFKGFYVGANLGGSASNADTKFTPLPDEPTFFSLKTTTLSPSPSGFIGGGQVGYNWQGDSSFVFGAEADFQGGSIDGTKTVTPIIQSDGSPFGA